MVLSVTLAVVVALVIHRFPGNVLIVVDQYRVQVSLAFAILLVIASFAGLYVVIRILTWLAQMPERYSNWRGQRQEKREQTQLEAGWTALLEGRYGHAEKMLTRLSGKSADKRRQVLAMLSAARAAHEVGEFKRQDDLLLQAQQAAARQAADVDLNTAVAAAAADLWLQQGRTTEALAALQVDHVQPMRHLHTMRLMLRVYQQTQNHAKVLELARALRRKDAISQDEADKLIEAAAAALIRANAGADPRLGLDSDPGNTGNADNPAQSQGQRASWQACWKDLKSEEKVLPEVALAAAQAFQDAGNYKEATKVLEAALTSHDKSQRDSSGGLAPLNPKLLAAYARAEPEQVTPRLQKAEQWLEERKLEHKGKVQISPQNVDLLTTLGALCLAAQMWGQAQRYLEQSAKLRKDARVHALLGSLFDRIGQPQRAAQHWRLATAVSAALPILAQDVVLPAANTEADPIIPHSEGLDVYDAEPLTDVALTNVSGMSQTREYDEFFDSAPIPMGHFESIDEQLEATAEKKIGTNSPN
jgi:HemY protein